MTPHGYDNTLYVLPFDHRGSFETGMFGWKGALTAEQTAQIAAAKQVIYDGFKTAVAAGVPKGKAGILVDEQFGAAILRDAATRGLRNRLPGRKERAGGVRFRVRRGLHQAHRGLPTDVLQGSGALQRRGQPGTKPPAGGSAEATVGLPT